MLDPKQLDDFARRLAASMPKGVQVLQEDINRSFRATLEAGLNKLDLVTREEFDVQAAVLARTRAKLEALEARIADLEGGDSGSSGAGKVSDAEAPSA
jgi:BMFP domain-containing protein YqiC